MSIIINSNKWKCRTCGEVFSSRKKLQDHRKNEHYLPNNVSKFAGNHYIPLTKCQYCNRTFTTSSGLTSHEKSCINNPNRIKVEGHPVTIEVREKISKSMKELYKGKSIWATQVEKRKSYAEEYFDNIFPEAERNYHVNRFFLDLAWPERKCYIEVNGEQHYTEKGLLHDKEREEILESEGWTLISKIRWRDFQRLSNSQREDYIKDLKKSVENQNFIECPIKEKKISGKNTWNNLKELRWTLIQESNINFQKFGWVKEVSKLFGIAENKAGHYIKKNYPDFYETCYKRK